MIKVLSYGSGNVHAILNIYKKLGIACGMAENADELSTATKLILPGVGAFDEAIARLENSGMIQLLNQLVTEELVPVLGVCVGMQIMGTASEEGVRKGLNWIPGKIKRIDEAKLTNKPKLPHLGWNSISPRQQSAIINDVDCERGFYFLHSYYFCCENEAHVLATTLYGEEFPCAIHSENIYGFQFHPEKSHLNGVTIFKNFATI